MTRLQLPQQYRKASFTPSTVDAEKRTAELVWTTGAGVRRFDWFTGKEFIEELSVKPGHVRMERLQNGAPLLNAHNAFQVEGVIGVVEKARLEKGQGVATVRFSERAEVQPIFDDVKAGILRNVSVAYLVHKFEERTDKEANIKTFRATDWEPTEISIVPVGADAGAQVRAGANGFSFCEVISAGEEKAEEETEEKPVEVPAFGIRELLALNDNRKRSLSF